MAHRFGKDATAVSGPGDLLEEAVHPVVLQGHDSTAIRTRVAVQVRPADVCLRGRHVVEGTILQAQRRSATCLLGEPVWVGSVFHLTFDREALDVSPTLAVCDRCVMLGDTAFEVRLQFVDEIDLPAEAERPRAE